MKYIIKFQLKTFYLLQKFRKKINGNSIGVKGAKELAKGLKSMNNLNSLTLILEQKRDRQLKPHK